MELVVTVIVPIVIVIGAIAWGIGLVRALPRDEVKARLERYGRR